ncbi:hypothetical protein [Streptomyces sp. OR43]|uniref:hypothetical protein n=1 Tax=Streptomyces sp. or43 TaxID=2478957 RepID=UPI0011CEB655|nr:hypothetical protein [Streptomyces sp. or43]TXS36753.1 hypothetical protein EAO72_25345 [Streptomyces sp. or43]
MSRSSWCCLVAALAVVLGLFCGPTTAAASTPSSTDPSVALALSVGQGDGVPGCGRKGKHDGTEPAVPGRARAAHDQAPGLAEWGLPAATIPLPVRRLVPMTPRGPDAAAPSPVELSVLRV